MCPAPCSTAMPDLLRVPRLLATLGLWLPLLAAAQATAPITDAERARRDAEKVFSFIKFQTVPKPGAEAKPPKPAPAPAPVAAAERPKPAARPAEAHATPATPHVAATRPADEPAVKTVAELAPVEPPPAIAPVALAPPTAQAAPLAAVALAPAFNPTPAAPKVEDAEDDDADDGALQLRAFVAPVLTPAVQQTLGAGSRSVKVRFTVEADGRVSQAEAAPQVPRRLAKPAVDAILQWQFAPLAQARTVDVEIAFRRD